MNWIKGGDAPENEMVLVTKNDRTVGKGYWRGKTKWLPSFLQEKSEKTWWVDGKMMLTGQKEDWEPRAWMPLPKPYLK